MDCWPSSRSFLRKKAGTLQLFRLWGVFVCVRIMRWDRCGGVDACERCRMVAVAWVGGVLRKKVASYTLTRRTPTDIHVTA